MKKILILIFAFYISLDVFSGISSGELNAVIVTDENGNNALVDSSGQLHVVMQGVEDSNNSTTTPLGIDGVFTGTTTDVSAYSAITILVKADQASASGGLLVQFSNNGTDWYDGESYTIPASICKFFTPPVQAQYYRIVYTNGGTGQTSFILHTMLKKQPLKWSSHNLQDNLNDEDDATLNVSVLKLRTAANTYVSGTATSNGNFKVSIEEGDNQAAPVHNYITDDTAGTIAAVESAADDSVDLEDKNGLVTNAILNARISNTAIRPLRADSSTNTLQVIDYEHHEIHSGSTFRVQHNQDNIPATASSGCLVIAFFVPDQTKEPHMIWETSHEGNMTVTLYEGVTFNASAGTDIAPKNSNRNSAITSVLQGKATGSLASDYVTVGENSVDSIYTGGTAISIKRDYSTKNVAGGQVRRNEIVLKTNTNYAFCLENNETSTQGGQIRLEWYEHTPKN